jgi:hypothetical protein
MHQVIPLMRSDGTMTPLVEIEAKAIDYALRSACSRTIAAKMLGIGRSTLYRKLDEHRLENVEYDPEFVSKPEPEPAFKLSLVPTPKRGRPSKAALDAVAEDPTEMSDRQVKAFVKAMDGDDLVTIQWVVEVRCGRKHTLGEIAEMLLH